MPDERCPRCNAAMTWIHQTWQCPRCTFKLGCCEGEPSAPGPACAPGEACLRAA